MSSSVPFCKRKVVATPLRFHLSVKINWLLPQLKITSAHHSISPPHQTGSAYLYINPLQAVRGQFFNRKPGTDCRQLEFLSSCKKVGSGFFVNYFSEAVSKGLIEIFESGELSINGHVIA